MYPKVDSTYYPPPQGMPQPVTTGIPVSSTNQFYTSSDTPAFQIHSQVPAPVPVQWSTSLCDCFDDIGNCCLTCFCPCITFGQIAEVIDRGSSSCGTSGALYTLIMCLTGCQCVYSCFYRSKMRRQYSLHESPCNDCLVHCCCESCALCQEYRELKRRGFDMKMGWHANMDKQGTGGPAPDTVPPTVQGGMSR